MRRSPTDGRKRRSRRLVSAVDTDIVARHPTRDDPEQAAIARDAGPDRPIRIETPA